MPHRDRYLFVCINRRAPDDPKGSCAVKGSEEVVKELKAELAKLGAKRAVRACSSSCLDLCESAVSIVVEPDHVAYGHVTLADVPEIARAAAEGTIVERLVVQDGRTRGAARGGAGGASGAGGAGGGAGGEGGAAS